MKSNTFILDKLLAHLLLFLCSFECRFLTVYKWSTHPQTQLPRQA